VARNPRTSFGALALALSVLAHRNVLRHQDGQSRILGILGFFVSRANGLLAFSEVDGANGTACPPPPEKYIDSAFSDQLNQPAPTFFG
jgi:hypothetical protein